MHDEGMDVGGGLDRGVDGAAPLSVALELLLMGEGTGDADPLALDALLGDRAVTLGDERNVVATYVMGERVNAPSFSGGA